MMFRTIQIPPEAFSVDEYQFRGGPLDGTWRQVRMLLGDPPDVVVDGETYTHQVWLSDDGREMREWYEHVP